MLIALLIADLLTQLVSVDTSQGHETEALKPVLALFQQAGIPAQLLESAPGRGNLIARLKGDGSRKPLLLLAHIDVVPVEGQKWNTPPFTPTERDGYLYGRGVGDDKAMAASIVEVALGLKGQKLNRDVIVALTSGEETGGNEGVQWLVKNHRDLIDAELALNEGGALQLANDGSKVQVVGLAVAEKTYQSFQLRAHGPGGHSSVPPTDKDPALQLARALVEIGEYRFPAHVIPEARAQLAAAARIEPQPLSGALAEASCGALSPDVLDAIGRERVYNAMIRTTCVTTQLKGSPQDNVLPTVTEAVVNCRILPDETIDQTAARLREAIADPGIEMTPVNTFGPGGKAPLTGPVPDAVAVAAHKVFGDATVVESLQLGATDSRYLREIGIAAYGVATAPSSIDDTRKGFGSHGANERRPLKWLKPGTEFLRALVAALAR